MQENHSRLRSLLCCAILFCAFSSTALAQAPVIQWEKSVGGFGNDYAYCIQQTFDSSYVVAGTSNSTDLPGQHGGYDAFVVKISWSGELLWQTLLGGSSDDYAYVIRQTIDSGYIVAGSSKSHDGDLSTWHGNRDGWVIKLSASGTIEWQAVLGGSADDYFYDIRQTLDSGYIVAGHSASSDGNVTVNHGGYDDWVVKLSSSGILQWQHSYGGGNNDDAVSVLQTPDSGYILAGDTYSVNGDITSSKGGEDFWILKLSPNGTIQWQQSLGGTGSDYAQSIALTDDGGYIVAGGSNSTDGDITSNIGSGDYWIVKLSAAGHIQWQKSFGSSGNDAANSIAVTSDGGYMVSGWITANDNDVTGFYGSSDYWVIKLSSTGSLQWQKCMGSVGNENASSGIQTKDGGYIVTGYTTFQGGDVTALHGGTDCWIVKLAMPSGVNEITLPEPISVVPNPTNGNIVVRGVGIVNIQVYSSMGVLIKSVHNINCVSIADAPPGIYFVQVTDKDGQVLKQDKVLKL